MGKPPGRAGALYRPGSPARGLRLPRRLHGGTPAAGRGRVPRGHPPLVDYALAHAGSATFQVRFFWQPRSGTVGAVDLDRAPPDSHGQAVLVTVTPMELPAGLTPRELDVLTLMACGLSNQGMARLHTSSRTVSTQVEHVLGKLGQASRAGAAGVAADRGYLRLPVPGSGVLPEGITSGTFMPGRRRPRPAPAVRPAPRPPSAGPPRVGPAAAADRLGLPAARSRPPRRREMVNGSALAAAEINASGGIGGRRIEQIVVDMDIFSTHDVARVLQQLIDAEVDAITSSYLFAGMDTARMLAAAYGAPYVHA